MILSNFLIFLENLFGAPRGPRKISKQKKVMEFQKMWNCYKTLCSPTFLAHVRTFRPPVGSLFRSEPIPGGPRPELRNVCFPCVCARPRARARAPARARARAGAVRSEGGEEGVLYPPLSQTLSLRRTASQHIKDMLGC